jgi:hypothetical protein
MIEEIGYRKERIIDSDFISFQVNTQLFSYRSDYSSGTWLILGNL